MVYNDNTDITQLPPYIYPADESSITKEMKKSLLSPECIGVNNVYSLLEKTSKYILALEKHYVNNQGAINIQFNQENRSNTDPELKAIKINGQNINGIGDICRTIELYCVENKTSSFPLNGCTFTFSDGITIIFPEISENSGKIYYDLEQTYDNACNTNYGNYSINSWRAQFKVDKNASFVVQSKDTDNTIATNFYYVTVFNTHPEDKSTDNIIKVRGTSVFFNDNIKDYIFYFKESVKSFIFESVNGYHYMNYFTIAHHNKRVTNSNVKLNIIGRDKINSNSECKSFGVFYDIAISEDSMRIIKSLLKTIYKDDITSIWANEPYFDVFILNSTTNKVKATHYKATRKIDNTKYDKVYLYLDSGITDTVTIKVSLAQYPEIYCIKEIEIKPDANKKFSVLKCIDFTNKLNLNDFITFNKNGENILNSTKLKLDSVNNAQEWDIADYNNLLGQPKSWEWGESKKPLYYSANITGTKLITRDFTIDFNCENDNIYSNFTLRKMFNPETGEYIWSNIGYSYNSKPMSIKSKYGKNIRRIWLETHGNMFLLVNPKPNNITGSYGGWYEFTVNGQEKRIETAQDYDYLLGDDFPECQGCKSGIDSNYQLSSSNMQSFGAVNVSGTSVTALAFRDKNRNDYSHCTISRIFVELSDYGDDIAIENDEDGYTEVDYINTEYNDIWEPLPVQYLNENIEIKLEGNSKYTIQDPTIFFDKRFIHNFCYEKIKYESTNNRLLLISDDGVLSTSNALMGNVKLKITVYNLDYRPITALTNVVDSIIGYVNVKIIPTEVINPSLNPGIPNTPVIDIDKTPDTPANPDNPENPDTPVNPGPEGGGNSSGNSSNEDNNSKVLESLLNELIKANNTNSGVLDSLSSQVAKTDYIKSFIADVAKELYIKNDLVKNSPKLVAKKSVEYALVLAQELQSRKIIGLIEGIVI